MRLETHNIIKIALLIRIVQWGDIDLNQRLNEKNIICTYAYMHIGVAVHFALVKRLGGISPKALVGVVKYGCINIHVK